MLNDIRVNKKIMSINDLVYCHLCFFCLFNPDNLAQRKYLVGKF